MRMEPTRKLWLLILVTGCVLMVHYTVSLRLIGPGGGGGGKTLLPTDFDGVIQAAFSRLLLDDSVKTAIGENILRNVTLQIGRELLSSCYGSVTTTDWPEPPIYIVTPTYRRPEQLPELTRMAQTLMHVRNLVWLVIEDAERVSPLVTNLLDRTGIKYYQLVAPMPSEYKKKKYKPRGVSNRNRGLKWLRANATSGVFYFADDDNTYDIALFEEIRTTKKVSMFPVGLCTRYGVSSPIVKNGKFAGFYDGWISKRKFPVDMAGFAVNLEFLFKRPKAQMPYVPGYEEDGFLKSLSPFEPEEIEFKADNCTKILVWHTQTKKNEPATFVDSKKYKNTNIVILKEMMV